MTRRKLRLSVSREQMLRGVIAGAILVSLVLWGLPFLIGPAVLLDLIGIKIPDDPYAWLFVRLFGALVVAGTYLYWHAYRDPPHHPAILRWAVLVNGLVAVTLAVVGLTQGIAVNPAIWASAALAAAFSIAFAVLLPKDRMRIERRSQPRSATRRRRA
jgi:hypothetical protein